MALLFSPEWFRGYDIALEAFSMLVAFCITYFAWKSYTLTKEAKYKYFSIAFASIGASFLARFLTTLAAFITVSTTTAATEMHAALDSIENLFSFGRILYILLILGGYLILLLCTMEVTNKKQIALFLILTLLLSYVASTNIHIFYLASLTYLTFVTLHYHANWKKNKRSTLARLTFLAFGLMLIEIILFILSTISPSGPVFYVAAYAARCISYLVLLGTFIKVWLR